MRRRWTRTAALLAMVALVAAGCGSDRSEDTSAPADEPGTEQSGSAEGTSTSFGDLESPCGEGDAAGATDEGVTDDAITIGYGDDAGFPGSPGLNHEMSDAVSAMIDWCNAQGGINGREVVGNYYDGKITEVNNAMTQACNDEVFMLVGEGYALDASQEEIRLGCELPAFPAFAVSPQFANAPLMISALPNPVDFMPVTEANWYAKNNPEKAKKLAFMYANYAATQDTAAKSKSAWPNVGMVDIECDQVYNIAGESDWKPFMQKLKDCGAEVVAFIGSPFPNFQNALEAAEQLEFRPDWLTQANFYDAKFAEWNTDGLADNMYVRIQDAPLEFAEDNPATQAYLDIVEEAGGDVSALGLHAASAFLLWAQSVKACGDDVTRDCVLAEAAKVDSWDAGGAHGEMHPGTNMPGACEIVLSLDGTEWEQVSEGEQGEFDCDEENVQEVTGEVVDKVGLEDRVVTDAGA
jgi:ABC-type branched-subunit amino acid transport system substrate-binding protein